MSKPVRLQLSRRHKLPPNSKSVARPHKYGNPFKVEDYGLDNALMLYRTWLAEHPDGKRIAADAKRELRGKNLACFCKLDAACHADILLVVANQEAEASE